MRRLQWLAIFAHVVTAILSSFGMTRPIDAPATMLGVTQTLFEHAHDMVMRKVVERFKHLEEADIRARLAALNEAIAKKRQLDGSTPKDGA